MRTLSGINLCSFLEKTITPPLGLGWRDCIVECKFRFSLIFRTACTSTLVSVSTRKSIFFLVRTRRVEILGPEPGSDSDFNPPTFCVAMLIKSSWWWCGWVMMGCGLVADRGWSSCYEEVLKKKLYRCSVTVMRRKVSMGIRKLKTAKIYCY